MDPTVLAEKLHQADEAFAADHLTYPEVGSAYALWREILAVEPHQEDALRGLERLVEHYIELCMRAIERQQFASARSMLARARLISPQHPSIKPSAEKIRLLSQAQRTRLPLSQDDLNKRDANLSAELRTLARVPSTQSCRFIISAKNDAQGRWIYQTLSKANADGRLSAQIEIRLPAGVERVCFPT